MTNMITILPVSDAIRYIKSNISGSIKRKISNSKVYIYRNTEVIKLDGSMLSGIFKDSNLSNTNTRLLRDSSELTDTGRKFHDPRVRAHDWEEVWEPKDENLIQLIIETEDNEYYSMLVDKKDLAAIEKEINSSGDKIISTEELRSFSIKAQRIITKHYSDEVIKRIPKTDYYLKNKSYEGYNDVYEVGDKSIGEDLESFLTYFDTIKTLYIYPSNYEMAGYSSKRAFMSIIANYLHEKRYETRYEAFRNSSKFVVEHKMSKAEIIRFATYLFDNKDFQGSQGDINDDLYGHMISNFI